MRLIALLILALSSLSVYAQSQPSTLELKGIQVGKQIDCNLFAENNKQTARAGFEEKAFAFALKDCETNTKNYLRGSASFVNVPNAQVYITFDADRNVASINIAEDKLNFETALNGFKEKFGKPVMSTKTLKNGLGATFEQVTAVWTDKTGAVLTLKNMDPAVSPRYNPPSATLVSKEFIAQASEKAKKATGNI